MHPDRCCHRGRWKKTGSGTKDLTLNSSAQEKRLCLARPFRSVEEGTDPTLQLDNFLRWHDVLLDMLLPVVAADLMICPSIGESPFGQKCCICFRSEEATSKLG